MTLQKIIQPKQPIPPVDHNLAVKSLVLLLLLGFIWGSGYSLARYAMTNAVHPLGYAFWQSLGPACLLSLVCFFKQDMSLFKRCHWRFFMICGLIGIAVPNTNMYFAAATLPASTLAVLVNTVPLMIYPLALLTRQEKPDLTRFAALLVGLIGLTYLIYPSKGIDVHPQQILVLITPFSFALCAIFIAAKKTEQLPPLSAAAGMLLCASLFLTPIVFAHHAFYPITLPMNFTQMVVVLEIILSSLGYLIFFRLIRLAGPVYYSLTGGVVAVTGVLWGVVLFEERLHWAELLGTLLILISISLFSWRQQTAYKERNENG